MVGERGIEVMFFQKLFHGSCEPHEALGRILNAEEDPMLNAKAAKLLGHVVQSVGGVHTDLVMWS